jgi:hypothetical protein
MASLNLSVNGPSIRSSYQAVVNGPGLSSNSSTYAQWALFSVQAPLLNAFQDTGSKESVLKVESTGGKHSRVYQVPRQPQPSPWARASLSYLGLTEFLPTQRASSPT